VTTNEPQNIGTIQQTFAIATAASCATALGFRKIFSPRGNAFSVNSIIPSYFYSIFFPTNKNFFNSSLKDFARLSPCSFNI